MAKKQLLIVQHLFFLIIEGFYFGICQSLFCVFFMYLKQPRLLRLLDCQFLTLQGKQILIDGNSKTIGHTHQSRKKGLKILCHRLLTTNVNKNLFYTFQIVFGNSNLNPLVLKFIRHNMYLQHGNSCFHQRKKGVENCALW